MNNTAGWNFEENSLTLSKLIGFFIPFSDSNSAQFPTNLMMVFQKARQQSILIWSMQEIRKAKQSSTQQSQVEKSSKSMVRINFHWRF